MENGLQDKLDALGWAEGKDKQQDASFALFQEIVRCLRILIEEEK